MILGMSGPLSWAITQPAAARDGGGGGASLLLDTGIATANNAYSLRKLRTAYAGFAIKVRRSSDNTTQDIGFSGEELDTTALLAFCGAGNGFIDTWYDQVGSANLVQVTNGNQPRIVSGGAVDVKNTKPCLVFDGSTTFLYRNGASIGGASQVTANAVAHIASDSAFSSAIISYTNGQGADDSSSADLARLLARDQNNQALRPVRNGVVTNGNIVYSQLFAATSYYNATQNILVIDGAAQTPAAFSATAFSTTTPWLSIGSASAIAAGVVKGGISEVILWTSALSGGDLTTLYDNQKAYWGTP